MKVDNEKELKFYNDLFEMGRLGTGECSAIACATNRGFHLVMEDVHAYKEALKISPDMIILKTQDIMTKLIEDKILSIVEADFIVQKEGLSYD